jgi:hypothetical protein
MHWVADNAGILLYLETEYGGKYSNKREMI